MDGTKPKPKKSNRKIASKEVRKICALPIINAALPISGISFSFISKPSKNKRKVTPIFPKLESEDMSLIKPPPASITPAKR